MKDVADDRGGLDRRGADRGARVLEFVLPELAHRVDRLGRLGHGEPVRPGVCRDAACPRLRGGGGGSTTASRRNPAPTWDATSAAQCSAACDSSDPSYATPIFFSSC